MGASPDDLVTTAFPLDDFRGGMRMDMDPSKLGPGEYFFLSNGRNRKGVILPVKLPLQYTGLPTGNYQSLYGAGTFLLAFINGKAYFQDFSKPQFNYFTTISGFQMDPAVDSIFTALVPASTVNFARESLSTLTVPVPPASPVNLTTGISGSPVCAVCQDGLNQPRLIFPNGVSRLAQRISEWKLDQTNRGLREYVPIGKQMLFAGDGKLYMASPEGKELYHSVTGRPLDFVIAVDKDGNKLNDGLFKVEASRLSHKVDFDSITCLGRLTSDNSDLTSPAGIFVSTDKVCYKVTPNYSSLLFGEPTFRNTFLFSSGALNNVSFIPDLLGDALFIDGNDIRSFNAVKQFQVEGNNSPFNQSVYPLFDKINQTTACTATFENYAVFAVNTVFGYGVLVFDSLIGKFVAFDQYPGIGAIKQFAPIKVNSKWRLFFMTGSGIYEAFAGDVTATAKFYPKEIVFPQPDTEHSLNRVRYVMQNAQESGTLTVTDYCDRLLGEPISSPVSQTVFGQAITPIEIPFGDSSVDSIDDDTIPFTEANLGHKIGVMLQWDCLAELRSLLIITTPTESMVSQSAAAKAYDLTPEELAAQQQSLINAGITTAIPGGSVLVGSALGDSGGALGSPSEGSVLG